MVTWLLLLGISALRQLLVAVHALSWMLPAHYIADGARLAQFGNRPRYFNTCCRTPDAGAEPSILRKSLPSTLKEFVNLSLQRASDRRLVRPVGLGDYQERRVPVACRNEGVRPCDIANARGLQSRVCVFLNERSYSLGCRDMLCCIAADRLQPLFFGRAEVTGGEYDQGDGKRTADSHGHGRQHSCAQVVHWPRVQAGGYSLSLRGGAHV